MDHSYCKVEFNCETSIPETYSCKDCNFRTDLMVILKKHSLEVHTTPIIECTLRIYICKNCTFETYSSLQWLNHLQVGCFKKEIENEDLFKCYHCSFQTERKLELSKHFVKEHTAPEAKNCLYCYRCPYNTENADDMKKHKLEEHERKKQIFTCDKCSYSTLRKACINKHVRRHPVPEKLKWFQCAHCPYKTKQRTAFVYHEFRDHKASEEIQWFKCEHCMFKTMVKSILSQHVITYHTSIEQLFECDLCSYKSNQDTLLKKHILLKHANSNLTKETQLESKDKLWFVCVKCPFKAEIYNSLKNHIIVKHQTEISQFECCQCVFKGESTEALYYHVRTIHETHLTKLWFDCGQCSYKTQKKLQFDLHMRSNHTPADEIQWFYCEQCVFKSKYKSSMDRHMDIVHAKQKTSPEWLQCEHCPFITMYTAILSRHLMKHKFRVRFKSIRISCTNCCVEGCTNMYANTDESVKFYVFPNLPHEKQRREQWIESVKRHSISQTCKKIWEGWEPKSFTRICSQHFVGNSKSNHPHSPSYVPTIFP